MSRQALCNRAVSVIKPGNSIVNTCYNVKRRFTRKATKIPGLNNHQRHALPGNRLAFLRAATPSEHKKFGLICCNCKSVWDLQYMLCLGIVEPPRPVGSTCACGEGGGAVGQAVVGLRHQTEPNTIVDIVLDQISGQRSVEVAKQHNLAIARGQRAPIEKRSTTAESKRQRFLHHQRQRRRESILGHPPNPCTPDTCCVSQEQFDKLRQHGRQPAYTRDANESEMEHFETWCEKCGARRSSFKVLVVPRLPPIPLHSACGRRVAAHGTKSKTTTNRVVYKDTTEVVKNAVGRDTGTERVKAYNGRLLDLVEGNPPKHLRWLPRGKWPTRSVMPGSHSTKPQIGATRQSSLMRFFKPKGQTP